MVWPKTRKWPILCALTAVMGCGSTDPLPATSTSVDASADSRRLDSGAELPPGGQLPPVFDAGLPPPPGDWQPSPPQAPTVPGTSRVPPRHDCPPFMTAPLPGQCARTLNDTFDSGSTFGWSYHEECLQTGRCTGAYHMTIANSTVRIYGDAYLRNAGIQKIVPVAPGPFLLRFRWRATAENVGPMGSPAASAMLEIRDQTGARPLYVETLVPITFADTGCFQLYSKNLDAAVLGQPLVMIRIFLTDVFTQDFQQELLIDDVQLENCSIRD